MSDVKAPDGFDINVGRKNGDGWVSKTPGQVVQGKILGRYLMKKQTDRDGNPRAYYQVELEVECQATRKRQEGEVVEDDGEGNANDRIEVLLKPGQVVNVDESKALEELEPYTRDGGVYRVWFQYDKQDPKLRNFWRVNGPKLSMVKPPKAAPVVSRQAPSAQPGDGKKDDGLPF